MAADKICKIDGCGNPKDSFGLCKLHAARMRRHGDPLAGGTGYGVPAAFIERAVHYDGDECLIWPFSKTKGYAAIRKDGRLQYVSRIICERVNGPEPFEGSETLHGCGNGHLGCITGSHLRWGTHAENMSDMVLHGRSNKGRVFGPPPPERVARQSASLKGRVCSPETRAKIGAKARERHRNAPSA